MRIGIQPNDSWCDEKYYPSLPCVFNRRLDAMGKMDPRSHEWGYAGRKCFAQKMWAPTAAGPLLVAHLKTLAEYPPRQGADSLSMQKAIKDAMKKLDNPRGDNNKTAFHHK